MSRNGSIKAAEELLARGYCPIGYPTLLKGPPEDARYSGWNTWRPTPETLDQYVEEHGNVGILLGEPSHGLIDIDLDMPQAVTVAPFLLPHTRMIHGRPGNPKSHWWYLVDSPPRRATEKLYDTDDQTVILEVRSTGGQTMTPPSVHPCGERLTWDIFEEPAHVAFCDLHRAAGEVAAAALLAIHWPAKGSRDDASLALAGALCREHGWDVPRVERIIEAVVTAAGDEEARQRIKKAGRASERLQSVAKTWGWPKLTQIMGAAVVTRARTFLGAVRREPKKKPVRLLPPYKPFPVEALPDPLSRNVRESAAALGCDPSYVALPVLAVAASAIGNTRAIKLKASWYEPCVVWAGIVGESGTLKSPAYHRGVNPLFRRQKQLLQEWKNEHGKYLKDLAEYKAMKKSGEEDPGDPPAEPLLRRVVVSDVTIEKLAEVLEDNPRGILVARDELAAWLASFSRYKGKAGGSDLPNWLEIFRAGTIINDRKTGDRRTVYVHRANASVCGGIQPGVLARVMTTDFLDAGLAARLLMSFPPRQPKRWTEDDVDEQTEAAYDDLLDKLLALELDEDGPHALRLTPDARALWVRFYEEWAQEQASTDGVLAAALSKLEGYAARLALIHHVVTHVALDTDDLRPVGTKSIEAGITLCRWFAHEARRIYLTFGETREERETRRLIEFVVSRGGRTTAKQLQRNTRRYPNADAAADALEGLVQGGHGHWEDRPPGPQGGRPTQIFVLDTHADETDETSPDDRRDDDDSDGGSADETADLTPKNPTNPAENEVKSVSSAQRVESQERKSVPEPGPEGSSGFVGAGEVSSARDFMLINSHDQLSVVQQAIEESIVVGLDLETTGLDPRQDRPRLVSLATERGTWIVDAFQVDPTPLFPLLTEKQIIGHNLAFDLSFLMPMGFQPGKLCDTILEAQLLAAGTPDGLRCGLADVAQKYLNRQLDKSIQRADWTKPLTSRHLSYAADDADVLLPLHKELTAKLAEAKLHHAAKIENMALPAIAWMGTAGVPFDPVLWEQLAGQAEAEALDLQHQLDTLAPRQAQASILPGGAAWDWNSAAQVKACFKVIGFDIDSTTDEALAGIDHPLADVLRKYRSAHKRVNSYGRKFIDHAVNGRIYPSWRQIGAASGRMACSDPNVQQMPRGDYRRCVRAAEGMALVWCDFSQIELRIAAKIAKEEAMLEAFRTGADLHTQTAQKVLKIENVGKEHRQLAKALNFGLLYGMGAKGFRVYAKSNYGLTLTEEQATQYREAFFATYPGLRSWHRRQSNDPIETRTLAGRRRLNVVRFTEKLNTPVQGTGADGLKIALGYLWQRRAEVPSAKPIMAVHDELVIECPAGHVQSASEWVKRAMVDAVHKMLSPVPVVVDVGTGQSWKGT